MPNNITLRILGSLCIGKYKESQAFALGELTNTSIHTFSQTSREILLLKYDIWFRWLVEVEDVLRRRRTKLPEDRDDSARIAEVIMQISDTLEAEYTSILRSYSETFDPKYVEIWLRVHSYLYKYLRARILALTDKDVHAFMVTITDLLILVMDNTLFELHEIDNLFNGGDAFISYDDICEEYCFGGVISPCILTERLKVYKEAFPNISKTLTIKDYSAKNTMITDRGKAKKVLHAISELGFTVTSVV